MSPRETTRASRVTYRQALILGQCAVSKALDNPIEQHDAELEAHRPVERGEGRNNIDRQEKEQVALGVDPHEWAGTFRLRGPPVGHLELFQQRSCHANEPANDEPRHVVIHVFALLNVGSDSKRRDNLEVSHELSSWQGKRGQAAALDSLATLTRCAESLDAKRDMLMETRSQHKYKDINIEKNANAPFTDRSDFRKSPSLMQAATKIRS